MPVTLPDPTVFDADSDKISTSRPELKKMADAIVTIGGEYNSGSLGGGGVYGTFSDVSNYGTITSTGSTDIVLANTVTLIGANVSSPSTTIIAIDVKDQPLNSKWLVMIDVYETCNLSDIGVNIVDSTYASVGDSAGNDADISSFSITQSNSYFTEIWKMASVDNTKTYHIRLNTFQSSFSKT